MRTIAKRGRFRALAATEIDGGACGGAVFQRNEFRAFMATVAKGLCFGTTAGAPEIVFALLDSNGKRMLGSDFWFGHNEFLS
jgi:hypothetical protein